MKINKIRNPNMYSITWEDGSISYYKTKKRAISAIKIEQNKYHRF